MNIGEQLDREWHEARDAMRHLMHHGAPQPAALATLHNETSTAQREEPPMSSAALIAEVKQDFATVGQKLAALDEAIVARAEQIAQIPGATELVDALISTLGISPALVSTFTTLIRDVGAAVPQPAPAEPQPVQ